MDRPPLTKPGNAGLEPFLGLLNPKNLYQELWGIIKFRTENLRKAVFLRTLRYQDFIKLKPGSKFGTQNKERGKMFLKK